MYDLSFQNEGCDRIYYVFKIFATFFSVGTFQWSPLYRKIIFLLSRYSVRLDCMACCSQWSDIGHFQVESLRNTVFLLSLLKIYYQLLE